MSLLRNRLRTQTTLSASLLSWGLVVGACSSDASNPQPVTYHLDSGRPPTDAGSGAADSSTSHDATVDVIAKTDAVTPTPDATLPTDGALPPDALVDVSVIDGHTVDAAVCEVDGGCYRCTPTTNAEFLNQCTASTCTPFDNASRLPKYDGGGLAPLGS